MEGITAERLKLTAFTLPLFYDKTVLMIPNPGTDESFSQQVRKVMTPFTTELWGLIIATILVASLFGVWFTERAPINNPDGSPRLRRKSAYLRLAFDSCLEKGLFFCSAGVEQDSGSTLPSKLLMAGYGFIILTRQVHCYAV